MYSILRPKRFNKTVDLSVCWGLKAAGELFVSAFSQFEMFYRTDSVTEVISSFDSNRMHDATDQAYASKFWLNWLNVDLLF